MLPVRFGRYLPYMIEDGKRSSAAGSSDEDLGLDSITNDPRVLPRFPSGTALSSSTAQRRAPQRPAGGRPEGRHKGGSAGALLSPRARRVTDARPPRSPFTAEAHPGGRRVACPGGPRQSNRLFDCEGPERP